MAEESKSKRAAKATAKADTLNVTTWLVKNDLLSADASEDDVKRATRWVTRTFKQVAYVNPKRGVYLASEKALNQALADLNEAKAAKLDTKKLASQRLNVVNTVLRTHNAALKAAGRPELTTATQRQAYYESAEGRAALTAAFEAAGIEFVAPTASNRRAK